MGHYNVFGSHAWSYSDRYFDVLRLLNIAEVSIPWFSYRNYSVPSHAPITDPSVNVRIAKLTALLREQIRMASCVIVPAGMYVYHHGWIQREINIARNGFSYPKKLIGIRRRGQQKTPVELVAQIALNAPRENTASKRSISIVTNVSLQAHPISVGWTRHPERMAIPLRSTR
ncbi:TIR domain-containing protein [Rhizobium leguminosarum]|uniref:TIR domain-containing protein n=1 Tax=Rhizobium leguminosarum TaxID=384 RepID=UPI001C96E302|nr:TIR domain-containing protein [Rhizobium leguminosarum]MBY5523565.1 nuclease [Rhizobium leguminosarum]